jgi:hypothetical protein
MPRAIRAGQVVSMDLVVSVTKNLRQNWTDGNFYIESQLWRYRRKG